MDKVEVKKPTKEELESMEVKSWPTWGCEASSFDWEYDDKESCYIIEGDVTVVTPEGEVKFGAGDFVVFPKGLKCKWNVHQRVLKHYKFG